MKRLLILFLCLPLTSYGAIAHDASSYNSWNTASSQTWSHTITGTDTFLVVYGWVNNSSDSVTSVTYNGVSMTRLNDVTTYNGGGNRAYLYYLFAPDTGTHNIVATLTGSYSSAWIGESYTGASQSTFPDSYVESGGDGSSNTYSINTTTTSDNSWVLGFGTGLDGICSAGSGTTMRTTNNPFSSDSGGAISPAGSASQSYVSCGNRVEDKMIVGVYLATSSPTGSITYGTTSPFATTTIYYHDWLFVNAIIVGLLGFLGIGFILNPIK